MHGAVHRKLFSTIFIVAILIAIRIHALLIIKITSQAIIRHFYEEDLRIFFESIHAISDNLNSLKSLLLYPNFNFQRHYELISMAPAKLGDMLGLIPLEDLNILLPSKFLTQSRDVREWMLDNMDRSSGIPLNKMHRFLKSFQADEQKTILKYILKYQTSSRFSCSWCRKLHDYRIFCEGDLWQLFDVDCYRNICHKKSDETKQVLEHIVELANGGNVLAKVRIAMIKFFDPDSLTNEDTLEADSQEFTNALREVARRERYSLEDINLRAIISAIKAQPVESNVKAAFLFELAAHLTYFEHSFEEINELINELFDDYGPDVVSPYAIRMVLVESPISIFSGLNDTWKLFIEREWFNLKLPLRILDYDKRSSRWRFKHLKIASRNPRRSYKGKGCILTNAVDQDGKNTVESAIAKANEIVGQKTAVDLDVNGTIKYYCRDKIAIDQIKDFWYGRIAEFAVHGVPLPHMQKLSFHCDSNGSSTSTHNGASYSNLELFFKIIKSFESVFRDFSLEDYKLFTGAQTNLQS